MALDHDPVSRWWPRALCAGLALLLSACGPSAPPEPPPVEPIDLTHDETSFVAAFNAAVGRPRLLVILPPT